MRTLTEQAAGWAESSIKGAGEAIEPAVDRQHSKRERREIDPRIGGGDGHVAHGRA
jgi:hypothetical protein